MKQSKKKQQKVNSMSGLTIDTQKERTTVIKTHSDVDALSLLFRLHLVIVINNINII